MKVFPINSPTNKFEIMTVSEDVLPWKRKFYRAPLPDKNLKELRTAERRCSLSQALVLLFIVQCRVVVLKTYKQQKQTQQVIILYACMYVCACIHRQSFLKKTFN